MPEYLAEYLLFFGLGPGQYQIWVSDGTTSGTQAIATAIGLNATEQGQVLVNGNFENGGLTIPGPALFSAYGKIYAQAGGQVNNEQLLVWDTQGTNDFGAWTYQVISPADAASDFQPQGFAEYEGLVYFNGVGADSLSGELFSTDGTPGNTKSISNWGLNPGSLTVAFGTLFFSGNNSSSDTVLYAYDGSGSTPYQVPDPNNPNNPAVYNPQYLTVSYLGRRPDLIDPPIPGLRAPTPEIPLFISGQDSSDATTTWLYCYGQDGTLTKIAPAWLLGSSSGLQPYDLVSLAWPTPVSFELFYAVCFSGLHSNGGRGLWISSGGTSGTTTQIDFGLPHGIGDLNPFNLTAFNGMLYFTGQDKNNLPSSQSSTSGQPGYGLYVYDPVTGDVSEVINSGKADLTFSEMYGGKNQTTMTVFNKDLYFSAQTHLKSASAPETVNNLWRANLDSQGNANPSPVYFSQDNALNPYSLTTISLEAG